MKTRCSNSLIHVDLQVIVSHCKSSQIIVNHGEPPRVDRIIEVSRSKQSATITISERIKSSNSESHETNRKLYEQSTNKINKAEPTKSTIKLTENQRQRILKIMLFDRVNRLIGRPMRASKFECWRFCISAMHRKFRKNCKLPQCPGKSFLERYSNRHSDRGSLKLDHDLQ